MFTLRSSPDWRFKRGCGSAQSLPQLPASPPISTIVGMPELASFSNVPVQVSDTAASSTTVPGRDGQTPVAKRQRTTGTYQRIRAVAACQVRRRRKVKCDNIRPVCGFCDQHGAECIYTTPGSDNDYSRLVPVAVLHYYPQYHHHCIYNPRFHFMELT